MTAQTTQPEQPNDGTINEHRSAFEALAALAQMFPSLPAGYVTVDTPHFGPVSVVLTFRSPQDFEQWRVAMQVPPADVELCSFPNMTWLASDAVFAGVDIHFTGHNVDLPHEIASVPQQQFAAAPSAFRPVVVPLSVARSQTAAAVTG